MKEFIEKLIGRLEHKLGDVNFEKATKEVNESFYTGLAYAYEDAIKDVNQFAEEYKQCTLCYLQSPCEYQNEDAILPNELLADKSGWIPCSSGEMPKCGEFDVKRVWVTMHRKGIDFYFTRKVCWNNYHKRWEWENGKEMADVWEVIAWMYIEVPAPYQPEGE